MTERRDSLGRAGRVSAKGNPVQTERVRELRPEDKRRFALDDVTDSRLTVTSPPAGYECNKCGSTSVEPGDGAHPKKDEPGETCDGRASVRDAANKLVPVERRDEHRSLMYLDARGEARPPREWEDGNAEKRAEVGRREAELNLRATRKAREQLSLSQRIAQLEHATLRMQSQRASTLGNDADRRRGADTKDLAPQGEGHGAVGFARPVVVEAHWRLVLLHVKRLEAFFDAHEGRAVEDPFLFSQAEKDQLLTGRELRGLSPEQIFALYDGALGDVKAVRYARRMAGLDPLGYEITREDAA